MNLNIDKCVIFIYFWSTSPSVFMHHIDNEILTRTNQHLNLGLFFIHWCLSLHTSITYKQCNKVTKLCQMKLSQMRWICKVCCLSWISLTETWIHIFSLGPHLFKDIQSIKRVQRIAARWVKSNYNWESSVTSMLSELQWPALNLRRYISKVTILYQGLHNLISLEMLYVSYITTTTTTTTHLSQHPFHFNTPTAKSNYYHNSYFLRTFVIGTYSAIEARTLKPNYIN